MNILDFARKAVISVGVALCVGFSANTAMAVDVTQYEHTNQEYFDNLKATIVGKPKSRVDVYMPEIKTEFNGEVTLHEYLYDVIHGEVPEVITTYSDYFRVPLQYFNISVDMADQFDTYLMEFQLDHPELLIDYKGWNLITAGADNKRIKCSHLPKDERDGACIEVIDFYVEVTNQDDTVFNMMETKMTELVDYTKQFNPGVEQVVMLHNKIIGDYEYDYDYKEHRSSPYQFFIYGDATCVAYSSLFNGVLHRLGYNTTYISNDDHIWSAVELDGEWYNVDVTWDEDYSKYSRNGYAQYRNFLVPDKEIEIEHEGPYFKFEEFTADSKKYMRGYLFNAPNYRSIDCFPPLKLEKIETGWTLTYKNEDWMLFAKDLECTDGFYRSNQKEDFTDPYTLQVYDIIGHCYWIKHK